MRKMFLTTVLSIIITFAIIFVFANHLACNAKEYFERTNLPNKLECSVHLADDGDFMGKPPFFLLNRS